MGPVPTGHEVPLADAAPPQCHTKKIKQGRGDGADWGMSCLRPTPRLHHVPTPTSVARLHGRPKEDLDGAARMSCTRRRRGAPWPPATGLEEPPISRRGRASGSRTGRPAVDPILSVQALHKAFSSLVLAVEKGKGKGRTPAGRCSAPAGGARGEPAQLAGRRGRLPNRAGERLAPPPWHQQ
jgi:hypothetical protein